MVSCMVALPTQLFRSTGIHGVRVVPGQEQGRRRRAAGDRPPRPDAVHRRPQPRPHGRSGGARFGGGRRRRGSRAPSPPGAASRGEYDDVPGFCRSVPTAEIEAARLRLTPGRYDGTASRTTALDEVDRLTKELFEAMDESAASNSSLVSQSVSRQRARRRPRPPRVPTASGRESGRPPDLRGRDGNVAEDVVVALDAAPGAAKIPATLTMSSSLQGAPPGRPCGKTTASNRPLYNGRSSPRRQRPLAREPHRDARRARLRLNRAPAGPHHLGAGLALAVLIGTSTRWHHPRPLVETAQDGSY